jgi:hypothetical protein
MRNDWSSIIAEHEATVAAFGEHARRSPPARWLVPPSAGKWTAAEETLHVVLAYEVGLETVRGTRELRRRATPARAAVLRWLVLPIILRSDWFPRASAPREIRPVNLTPEEASVESLISRLERAGASIAEELRSAERDGSSVRIAHPYFGPLALKEATRLMSAHTRHHMRQMARRSQQSGGTAAPATAISL